LETETSTFSGLKTAYLLQLTDYLFHLDAILYSVRQICCKLIQN